MAPIPPHGVIRRKMTMPKKPITIPKFRTEAEEAHWWDAHPEVATEIMNRAIKSGEADGALHPGWQLKTDD
jgi:hypothetical protein